jgi:hypothetical protein
VRQSPNGGAGHLYSPRVLRSFLGNNLSTCRGRRSSKPWATAAFSAVSCTAVRSAGFKGIHCFQAVKMSVPAFQAGCRGFESRLPLHPPHSPMNSRFVPRTRLHEAGCLRAVLDRCSCHHARRHRRARRTTASSCLKAGGRLPLPPPSGALHRLHARVPMIAYPPLGHMSVSAGDVPVVRSPCPWRG